MIIFLNSILAIFTSKKNSGVILTCLKNIKKITILSTMLITLTFSNNVLAGIFSDIGRVFNDMYRCKIEYTQLNIVDGVETVTKETFDFENDNENVCNQGTEGLIKKLYNWLEESPNNMIVKLDVQVECKEEKLSKLIFLKWRKYEACEEEYTQKIIDYVVNKYPIQIGYGIYDSVTLNIIGENTDL
jgi:hypothetical protein